MKMKEICARSGLTERAVRLYCDRGLVHPEKKWDNGREYLIFSDHNLRELAVISQLRHAEFTLDEISLMLNSPAHCGDVLAGWRGRVTEQNQRLESARQKLAELSSHDVLNAEQIAEALGAKITSHGAAPYEGETFAEFCERAPAKTDYCPQIVEIARKEERRERLGKTFLIFYSIVMGFVTLLAMGLTYASTLMLLPGLMGIALFVVLTIYLFRGAVWARVVGIVRHLLSAVVVAIQMPNYFPGTKLGSEAYLSIDGTAQVIYQYMPTELGILVTGALTIAVLLDLFCVYMLWFHKGVKEYLYDRSLDY